MYTFICLYTHVEPEHRKERHEADRFRISHGRPAGPAAEQCSSPPDRHPRRPHSTWQQHVGCGMFTSPAATHAHAAAVQELRTNQR